MFIPRAAQEHPAARLARAAAQADSRGHPEDLALLQLMTRDVYLRLALRHPPVPEPYAPVLRVLSPPASAPTGPTESVAAHELQACVARADWHRLSYSRRIADALIEVAYSRPPEAAAFAHHVALEDVRHSHQLLRAQGLQGLFEWLGQTA